MSTQAYDKDGNKIPFAVYKGDTVRGFQTVEQYEAQIASLTAENERLRTLVKEGYQEGFMDAREDIHFEKTWRCSNTYAALQPKEGKS